MLTHWKQQQPYILRIQVFIQLFMHLHIQIELHFVSTTLQIDRICLVWAVPEPQGDVSVCDCTA
jgi:hypothetical protein